MAAYFSLQKHDADRDVSPQWPDKQVQEDFGNPLTAVFSKVFVDRFVNQYCVLRPDENSPYDVRKLVKSCLKENHHTESGDFLIRQFLHKEYEKERGLSREPEPQPDPEPFPFLG
ncbi:MAG TPA: hypothetical protein VFS88_05145 [Micavibrio sp.]|nr:hypothetical protein [Micavibrio sp.]